MKNIIFARFHPGQSLIELLLAIALLGIMLPAVLAGFITATQSPAQHEKRVRSQELLLEAQETLRSIREGGWAAIADTGIFHPEVSGSTWVLLPGSETIDGILREIEIFDVQRDASGAIVSSGGSLDPSTKRVEIRVSWSSPVPASFTVTTYLTRYLDNLVLTETTEADFAAGTHDGTTTVNNDGGEIVLGSGGQGGWCNPFDSTVAELDLPKSGVANAITAIEGQAFVGTGENASGVSFANVNISNDYPPVPSIIGTVDGYKTNQVFGEAGYAYIATDTNSSEVVILNTSTYTAVGYYDAPGSTNGTDVFVTGDTGYMLQGDKLRNFDLTSKSGSRPSIDSDGVTLSATSKALYIEGSYAYVTLDTSYKQLEIVDISNPSNLIVVGYAQLNAEEGVDVVVDSAGTRAFVATENSGSKAEMFIVDISTKAGAQPTLGSYDSGEMNPKGLAIVPGNRAILVGYSGEEYQVINTINEASPTYCGGLDLTVGINGVASVWESDGDAYSYIITQDTASEFKIIEGGPGGQFSTDGSYESAIFDAGYETVFNYFEPIMTELAGTDISFQVGVADALAGDCTGVTFSYVGPDGTSSTFFDGAGALPLSDDGLGYENPGRCFSYKAFLSTENSLNSPQVEEVIVNYSP